MTIHYGYPPYGRMILEWEQDIGGPGSPPSDWDPIEDWATWIDAMSTLLSLVLWPRYRNGWVGPAQAFMDAITRTDFALLRQLRPLINTSARLAQGPVPQLQLFVLEDEDKVKDDQGNILVNRGPDVSLRQYLQATLPDATADSFAAGDLAGVHAKAGNVDLELKREMQRPRPYQMGFLLGEDWFTHNNAKSASTPSMISGHCAETLMGGAACYYRAIELGSAFPKPGWQALAQHTIDVGDRRVLAGVHYPSDNLSSWLTALLMCPLVCPDRRPIPWLWQAITTRSIVYAKIRKEMERGSDCPYRNAFRLLTAVGEEDVTSVYDALHYAKDALL